MLVLIAYGIATGNPWLQIGALFLVLGIQVAYQIYKGARSGPALEANMREAARAKRSKALQYVSERDVRSAQTAGGSSGLRSQVVKTFGMILLSLGTFLGTTYFIGVFWPETPHWLSYVAGFLVSMPVSLVLTAKAGMPSGVPQVTPSSYLVTERGIVFEQMGRSLIVKFPLVKVEKGKDGNSVEVDGIKENDLIPYRLRLYTDRADELLRILSPRVREDLSS